jgi:probable rRNA maturation factor
LPARSTLTRWIAAALERDAQLTLRFVGAREGRRLNRDFRGKDYPTDVLTFSYSIAPIVCADIVICIPVLKREAAARRKPIYDHLAHLIVHATLHAHGYHHDSVTAARAVEARERKILKALGKRTPY